MRVRAVIGLVALVAFGGTATAGASSVRVYRVSAIELTPYPGSPITTNIVLRYPGDWYATNRPLDAISNPVQRFVLSSYRVPGNRPNLGGNYEPPPTGVVARLMEDVPLPKNAGPRPSRPSQFKLPHVACCLEGYGGNRWTEIHFVEHGVPFTIYVGVGRSAPTTRVTQLLRTLDRMSVAMNG